jgi:hypothetical protein
MKKLILIFLALCVLGGPSFAQIPWVIRTADGTVKVNDPKEIIVTDGSMSNVGKRVTLITGAGGGGGTPGGASGTVQFNNVGNFGGISGLTTDGTNVIAGSGNLRATLPRFNGVTDTAGNEIFLFTPTVSAINEVTVANAAAGNSPTFTASGGDTDVGINFIPKGAGTIQVSGVPIATTTATQTLSGKTLITPTIASLVNANHNHQDAAGGGTLNASAIAAGILGIARGGTGVSAVDPDADRLWFWDDSAGNFAFLTLGTNLSITGTTINAAGGGGDLDVGTSPVLNGTATRLFYEAAGNVLGQVSGVTSDGTNVTAGSNNLRATGMRVITSVNDTNGNELFDVTATASAVNQFGIANAATGNGPTLSSAGETNVPINIAPAGTGALNLSAPLNMTGTGTVPYTTPIGSVVQTKIAVPNMSLGGFAQVIALGIPSSANSSSRVLTLLDQRSGAHQPTLNVLSPDETQVAGFSWNGSNVVFSIPNSAADGIVRLDAEFGGVTGTAFASLGAQPNGTFTYVSDGQVTSPTDNTCTSGGNGAWAFRINSTWRCFAPIGP